MYSCIMVAVGEPFWHHSKWEDVELSRHTVSIYTDEVDMKFILLLAVSSCISLE